MIKVQEKSRLELCGLRGDREQTRQTDWRRSIKSYICNIARDGMGSKSYPIGHQGARKDKELNKIYIAMRDNKSAIHNTSRKQKPGEL